MQQLQKLDGELGGQIMATVAQQEVKPTVVTVVGEDYAHSLRNKVINTPEIEHPTPMKNHWNYFRDKSNIQTIIPENTPQALVDQPPSFIKKINPIHREQQDRTKGMGAGAGIGVAIPGLIAGIIGLFSSNDAEANIGKLKQATDAAVDAMADATPIVGSVKAIKDGRSSEEAAHRFLDNIGWKGVLSVGDFSRYFSRFGAWAKGQESTVDAGNITSTMDKNPLNFWFIGFEGVGDECGDYIDCGIHW